MLAYRVVRPPHSPATRPPATLAAVRLLTGASIRSGCSSQTVDTPCWVT